MIRLATLSDMEQLLRMGKSFFDVSGYGQLTDFNYKDTEIILISLIEQDSLLTDGKNGMIGFLVFPMFMNSAYTLSQELFWWVDEDVRNTGVGIKILRDAERLAKEKGATTMMMLSIDDLNGDSINKLYKKLGYRERERTYMRSL